MMTSQTGASRIFDQRILVVVLRQSCRVAAYIAGRDSDGCTTHEGQRTAPEMPDLHNPTLFAALIRNRQVFMRFHARRIGNPADAEDVLQGFSMHVLARSDRLRADSETRLLAWLFAVLRPTLTDHFRKQQRESRKTSALAIHQAAEPPEQGPDDLRPAFCDCLRLLLPLLNPDQADLLQRVEFEFESRAAVASDLGVTPGALAVRLHRARIAMRNLLLGMCLSCPDHGWDDCACHPDKIECRATIEKA